MIKSLIAPLMIAATAMPVAAYPGLKPVNDPSQRIYEIDPDFQHPPRVAQPVIIAPRGHNPYRPYRPQHPISKDNSCIEGSIIGGIAAGALGGVLSTQENWIWSIPVGVIGGALLGCQIDGG